MNHSLSFLTPHHHLQYIVMLQQLQYSRCFFSLSFFFLFLFVLFFFFCCFLEGWMRLTGIVKVTCGATRDNAIVSFIFHHLHCFLSRIISLAPLSLLYYFVIYQTFSQTFPIHRRFIPSLILLSKRFSLILFSLSTFLFLSFYIEKWKKTKKKLSNIFNRISLNMATKSFDEIHLLRWLRILIQKGLDTNIHTHTCIYL